MGPADYTHINHNGIEYHLNCKDVTLRGGKVQRIYYFSKDHRAETACSLPEGMVVKENPRNGFLTVGRIK